MKVVIWGYATNAHTHFYTHEAFYKAFKHLEYDTYWFDDDNYPEDFDWDDCLFWTEGFADKNIPLNKTSTYFVHVAPDPAKYINANVKRFVDVRYNHLWHKDHVYQYTLDKSKVEKVGHCCYFQPKKNRRVQVLNDHHQYWIEDYDKFYVTWATNSLPEEFDFEDIHYPREENKIYFSGNLSTGGRCENYSTFAPFIQECQKNNIEFIHNDPFANPLTEEEVIERTKKSVLGVDIRGPEHLRNGYVPCRLFKNIGWGHLGTTNSEEVYKEVEGHCLFQADPAQLFYDAMEKRTDYEFIKNAMLYVQENHTFVNRVKTIMSLL
tara:strand:- start:1160 stop:2125 length:966 start_codon:yes stop_codon:yes gene_type:complete